MGSVTFDLMDIAVITAIVAAAIHFERRFTRLESQFDMIINALGIRVTAKINGSADEGSR